jgi:hypothetical protein
VYLLKKRGQVQKTRIMKDREILEVFVATIEHQETSSGFMSSVANPLMRIYFAIVKGMMWW